MLIALGQAGQRVLDTLAPLRGRSGTTKTTDNEALYA